MKGGFKTLEARNCRYEGIIEKRKVQKRKYELALRSKQTALEKKMKLIKNRRGWDEEMKEAENKLANDMFNEFKGLKEDQIQKCIKDIEYYSEAKTKPLEVFSKTCEDCNMTFKGKTALEQYEQHCLTRKHRLKTGELKEYWECEYCKQQVRKTCDFKNSCINMERHLLVCEEKDKPQFDENGNEIINHLQGKELKPFHFLLNFDETFEAFKKLNIKLDAEWFINSCSLQNNLSYDCLTFVYKKKPNRFDKDEIQDIRTKKDTILYVSEGWDLMIDSFGNPICDLLHKNSGTEVIFFGENPDDASWSIFKD